MKSMTAKTKQLPQNAWADDFYENLRTIVDTRHWPVTGTMTEVFKSSKQGGPSVSMPQPGQPQGDVLMWNGCEKNSMLSQMTTAFRSWDHRVSRDCRGEKITVFKQAVFSYRCTQPAWSDCLAGAVMPEMALSMTLCIGLDFPKSISAACSRWRFRKHFESVLLVKYAENGPQIPCLQASNLLPYHC